MRYLPNGIWMQKADSYTIREIGVPSVVLMEHAAQKTIEVMERENIDFSDILIVCGSGNNGGDGFAIARLLQEKGVRVTVFFAGKESSMSEECRLQAQIVRNLGIPIVTVMPEKEYTVLVDALFGVGLNREITGAYCDVIEKMNRLKGRKIAVDIPSGIHSGNGQVMGIAFRADLTVTFQCEKLGMVLFPGKEYTGKTAVVDIGIHSSVFSETQEVAYTLERADLSRMLPKRKPNTHKGNYGKVLMITGSKGMAGAAYLSALAAYTCGAGLVQIYTDETNRAILQQLLPEAIISCYMEYEEDGLKDALEWADVVCIGCGLGKSRTAEMLLMNTLKYVSVPCVIDADGLNLLACHKEMLRVVDTPVILTPHMKEMSGLLGCSIPEITEERFQKLQEFTSQYPVICVLKDARTVVAERTNPFFVNTAGNQAMAKAGSGDVLAGVITGLLAGKTPPYRSAVLGVYLHACGGDKAKEQLGSYSVLARDLITGIGQCMKEAEEEQE